MTDGQLLWMKDFLQDDLYLIETDKKATITTPPVVLVETITPGFNCLGQPSAGFLILVDYAEDEHMPAADLQSLESILGRKNIDIDKIAILNMAKQADKDYTAIVNYFKPQKIVIMGNRAVPDNFNAPELNITADGDIKILYTFSFKEMDSKDKKLLFWNEMKNF